MNPEVSVIQLMKSATTQYPSAVTLGIPRHQIPTTTSYFLFFVIHKPAVKQQPFKVTMNTRRMLRCLKEQIWGWRVFICIKTLGKRNKLFTGNNNRLRCALTENTNRKKPVSDTCCYWSESVRISNFKWFLTDKDEATCLLHKPCSTVSLLQQYHYLQYLYFTLKKLGNLQPKQSVC